MGPTRKTKPSLRRKEGFGMASGFLGLRFMFAGRLLAG